MLKSLTKLGFTTTLMLAAIVANSSRMLAQLPSAPSKTNYAPGCLFGYPDGTYRGDRPVTRYEFATGLNTCLNRVNQLLPNKDHMATREDFEALIKRQRDLNEQLRELSNRVGNPPTKKSSKSPNL